MKLILFFILSTLTFHSYAQDKYVCKSGNLERTVEVLYASSTSKVPCEVQYTKSSGAKILWTAQNDIGYCEEKARDFSLKLAGFGWACTDIGKEMPVIQ